MNSMGRWPLVRDQSRVAVLPGRGRPHIVFRFFCMDSFGLSISVGCILVVAFWLCFQIGTFAGMGQCPRSERLVPRTVCLRWSESCFCLGSSLRLLRIDTIHMNFATGKFLIMLKHVCLTSRGNVPCWSFPIATHARSPRR